MPAMRLRRLWRLKYTGQKSALSGKRSANTPAISLGGAVLLWCTAQLAEAETECRADVTACPIPASA